MSMRELPAPFDWERLRALRDLFLSQQPLPENYWLSNRHLQDYDISLGERIGWKWDAVLCELKARGWTPPSPSLTDLGCGTGVAARRLLAAFPGHWNKVTLWDRSEAAMRYARQKIRHEFPSVRVLCASQPPLPAGVVVISHLWTEIPDAERPAFLSRLEKVQSLLWVEPGTYLASRALVDLREHFRPRLHLIAPCTHGEACGLLDPAWLTDWCHHHAPAPAEAHRDPFWGRFRREMNLDIGPVAYSFLVWDRRPPTFPEGTSHLLGETLRAPKFVKVLSCQAEGLADLVAGKSCSLYRELKQGSQPALYRFERKKNRVQGGEWLGGAPLPSSGETPTDS